ncbi:MAG TPA: tetratricopeptide repeat protein [Bryobacteraceae bacterium]|jgi:tetratricopeptide (TPR) repeat protein|nr:tetratricopeptide repeat protein [Bryobacteraceae bacterium]
MFAQLRKALISLGIVMVAASAAFAQTTTMEGDVKDATGQPLKGAVIDITRTDIKGHYSVKSDKKGHWFYMGLPIGTYDIACIVEGKQVDSVKGVKSSISQSTVTDFDMRKSAAAQQSQQAAMQQAAATGQIPAETEKGMTKEQKDQFEAAAKKASETMKKNKALNDAFNAGIEAQKKAEAGQDKTQKAADFKTAIDSFNQAGQLDPTQVAVWDHLGQCQYGLGILQSGEEKNATLDAAVATFKKAVALKADDSFAYNQMGNALAAQNKLPEATDALTKAASLDPQNAATANFNIGAILVNHGDTDKAAEYFKKAIAANPNYAEAHYQLGIAMMGKASVDASGKINPPPGTAEEFQKYLELKPDGPYAQASKDMLTQLNATIETKTVIPQKKKK